MLLQNYTKFYWRKKENCRSRRIPSKSECPTIAGLIAFCTKNIDKRHQADEILKTDKKFFWCLMYIEIQNVKVGGGGGGLKPKHLALVNPIPYMLLWWRLLCHQVRLNESSPPAENPWYQKWYTEKYRCNVGIITKFNQTCASLYPTDSVKEAERRAVFVQVCCLWSLHFISLHPPHPQPPSLSLSFCLYSQLGCLPSLIA
jgi:hypothetical protein